MPKTEFASEFKLLQSLRASNPALSAQIGLFRRATHSRQVPGLSGISIDGTTVYIDKSIPQNLEGLLADRVFAVKETIRYALVKTLGYRLERATALAEAAQEHVLCHAVQPWSWLAWTNRIKDFEKEYSDRNLIDPPKDLALFPYSGRLYKTLWEFQQGKLSMKSSAYRPAERPDMQCSGCDQFRVKSSSCITVAGYILPSYVCDAWESK